MRFEINNKEIDFDSDDLPEQIKDMVTALKAFSDALKQSGNESEIKLNTGELKVQHITLVLTKREIKICLNLDSEMSQMVQKTDGFSSCN